MRRRNFLKSGLAGAAGFIALNPAVLAAADDKNNNIIYRTLGKTGLKVPVVSFGVMRSDNSSLVKAAYEAGITMFDTANGYQNGRNEEMLGGYFSTVPRESFILATKVKPSGVDSRTGLPSKETTAESFLEKFEVSLSRLKMSYVDILYMHSVDSAEMVNHKETVNAMLDLKKKGKVRFIGISTHKNEPLVIRAMVEAGIWDVVLTSYNFKQTYAAEMNEALELAGKAGLGVVAMKTMAGGFLDKEKTRAVDAPAALKWALANPNVHTTIPGITTFDQLNLDIPVMSDITLTTSEKEELMIASNYQGLYCNACQNCIPGCSRALPIPEMMRAYMYAYGYGNMALASDLLTESGVTSDPCRECESCTAECVKGFDIRNKLTDIARLTAVPLDFIS
jgi:predicted aldo/keto reductase-like oxidoreductase